MEFTQLINATQSMVEEILNSTGSTTYKNASVDVAVKETSSSAKVVISVSNMKDGTNLIDVIEVGRRPGKQPPSSVIEQWVRRKGIVPKSQNGRIPTTKSLSFLIARSIGKHGTEGKHWLSEGLNKALPLWMPRLEQALAEDIQAAIEKEIRS